VIAASLLLPATTNRAGYDHSRMASHRDPSGHHFNVYTSDLPITVSKKYAYANDLAIVRAHGTGKQWEECSKKTWRLYVNTTRTWKLKFSTTKAVSAIFQLNNKEAKGKLKVNFNNETLPFCCDLKYLGVTLDRTLTYHRHLESTDL